MSSKIALHISFILICLVSAFFITCATIWSRVYDDFAIIFYSSSAALLFIHFIINLSGIFHSQKQTLWVHTIFFVLPLLSLIIIIYEDSKLAVWGLVKTPGYKKDITNYVIEILSLICVIFLFILWFFTRKAIKTSYLPERKS